ncbi:MAG: HU family DNA-binding protein [Verrucomicrobia bacterium]|nr:HU family DNA-binding protein [Verrucomicrobiota bacterium]
MGVLITEISKALEKKGERARLERLITCYTVRKIAPTTGLTKNELVRAIAQKSGLTRKDAEEALDAFVATVKTAMKKKEKVNLVGFGTWELPQRKARRPINPRTGQEIKIPAGRVPIFKAGKALKELALTGTIEQARPKEVPESLRTSLEEQKKRSSEKGYSTE